MTPHFTLRRTSGGTGTSSEPGARFRGKTDYVSGNLLPETADSAGGTSVGYASHAEINYVPRLLAGPTTIRDCTDVQRKTEIVRDTADLAAGAILLDSLPISRREGLSLYATTRREARACGKGRVVVVVKISIASLW